MRWSDNHELEKQLRIEFLRVLRNILREFELVILVGKEFQRRGPVNIRERKPYWVVLDRSSDLKAQCPDCGHVRVASVFSSKDNRAVILTRQDFLPDRTANEDLLFTFSTEEYFRLSKKIFCLI